MVGFIELLRRSLGLDVAGRARARKSPIGACEMREYSRHVGLRHRWIDHD